jgi:hypothetical protein
MTRTTRKIFAVILLVLLLVVPFFNWKLGAMFWMSAWMVYIFQNMFSRRNWKLMEEDDEVEELEEWSENEEGNGDKELSENEERDESD